MSRPCRWATTDFGWINVDLDARLAWLIGGLIAVAAILPFWAMR